MCPQAEGRLRGEVDEARGYHDGARRVVCVLCGVRKAVFAYLVHAGKRLSEGRYPILIGQALVRSSWRRTRRTPLTAPLAEVAVLYDRRAVGGRVEWTSDAITFEPLGVVSCPLDMSQ